MWQRVMDIPDHELWAVRQTMKRKLMGFIRERRRARLDARPLSSRRRS